MTAMPLRRASTDNVSCVPTAVTDLSLFAGVRRLRHGTGRAATVSPIRKLRERPGELLAGVPVGRHVSGQLQGRAHRRTHLTRSGPVGVTCVLTACVRSLELG